MSSIAPPPEHRSIQSLPNTACSEHSSSSAQSKEFCSLTLDSLRRLFTIDAYWSNFWSQANTPPPRLPDTEIVAPERDRKGSP